MEVFDKPDILCIPHTLFGCDALVPRQWPMVYLHSLILSFSGRVLMWQLETQLFVSFLYSTGVHFWGDLEHGGDVSEWKIKCRPVRTREIGGVSLSDVLYAGVG